MCDKIKLFIAFFPLSLLESIQKLFSANRGKLDRAQRGNEYLISQPSEFLRYPIEIVENTKILVHTSVTMNEHQRILTAFQMAFTDTIQSQCERQ